MTKSNQGIVTETVYIYNISMFEFIGEDILLQNSIDICDINVPLWVL